MINNITDKFGILTAIVCIVHCIALPVILIGFAASDAATDFHVWSLVITVLITGHALWHGFKQHCVHRVLVIGGLGIGTLFLGVILHFFAHPDVIESAVPIIGDQLTNIDHSGHDHSGHDHSGHGHGHGHSNVIETAERVVTVIGSLLIVAAHIINLKYKSLCCR